MFPFFIPTVFLALLIPPAAQAQGESAAQYATCTALVKQNTQAALQQARHWHRQSGELSARHCLALAQYQLGQFKQAAAELDAILQSVSPSQSRLWFAVIKQAARAHLQAKNYPAAHSHLSEALIWTGEQEAMEAAMPPLLLQRARILALQGDYLRAVHDLDHAYALQPDNKLRLERARLFIRMGKNESAREDINAVLQEEPQNRHAATLLEQAEGAADTPR